MDEEQSDYMYSLQSPQNKHRRDENRFDEQYAEIFGDDDATLHSIISKNNKPLCGERSSVACDHDDTLNQDGTILCKKCGCKIDEILNFEPEWRFYPNAGDGGSGKDTSRCHGSKEATKGSIEKVFHDVKLDITDSLKRETEAEYKIVVDGQTIRGDGRKAIVAVCLFHIYIRKDDVRTLDEIRLQFKISKREISDGLYQYYAKFPEARKINIGASNLISRFLRRINLDMSHRTKIVKIINAIEDRDEVLKRAAPQYIACAVIYMYMCIVAKDEKERLKLNKTNFSIKCGLNDNTIMKLVKRIATLLGEEIDL